MHIRGDNEIYIQFKYSFHLVNVYVFNYETCPEIFIESCPQLPHFCATLLWEMYRYSIKIMKIIEQKKTSVVKLIGPSFVNSLRASDAYMRRQHKPILVQIMACRLYGTKPLSEVMVEYCQFDP